MTSISLIADDPSRFDPLSFDQLEATAAYEGIRRLKARSDTSASMWKTP